MKPNMRSYKRRQKIVDKKLQYQLTGVFLVGVLTAMLLFTAGMIGYYWTRSLLFPYEEFLTVRTSVEKTAEVVENGEVRMERYSVSEESLPLRPYEYLAPVILINNLLIMVVIGIFGIIYSHKIAGPMFNINRALDRAASGHFVKPITLRRGDFFHDTAEKINRLLIQIKNEEKHP